MKTSINQGNIEMPFIAKVSFAKLFDIWEETAATEGPEQERARYVLEKLKAAKVLREPFDDLQIISDHEEEISLLLSGLFPKPLQLNEIKAATLPFQHVFFNMTDRFSNILNGAGDDYEFKIRGFDEDFFYMMSSSYILNVGYQAGLNISRPTYFDIPDAKSGLMKTYRGFFNADFTELKFTDRSPKLTKDQIRNLIDHSHDIDLWKKTLPPGSFEMHGFGLLTVFDVSVDDAMSKLKNNLIDKNVFRADAVLSDVEVSLRKIFGIPDLRLGMSSIQGNRIRSIGKGLCDGLMLSGCDEAKRDRLFCSHSTDHLFHQKEFMAISDMDQVPWQQSSLLKAIHKAGVKSYIITPLTANDKVIGFLELGSARPHALNSFSENRLQEIAPLFAIALERNVDDYWTQLEAIIKEKCTAIHPAVEWRFVNAAAKVYRSGRPKGEVDMEEIVFDRVHPLFGQMDISGSSRYRDKGIQQDLLTQLKAARGVLDQAWERQRLLVYEQLKFALDAHMQRVQKKLNAGDETTILDFLKYEVDPVFAHLKADEELAKAVESYTKKIDPKIKMVYKGRKLYEDTVTMINENISAYIENAQIEAQEMFPHYFEKYKTDGVEYNMYIGQSLVDDRTYDPLFLKNLRIWQLVMTCEVENLLDKLRPEFKVPLRVASLILVQNKSLDIKFRMDEKKFDVDGAYNARYEIIKKRVDKAHINGSNERLTKPGKIAIVYSSEDEKREYEKYLAYLEGQKYIHPGIEYVTLEELQGASGLRAMRVDINYDREVADKQLTAQVEALMDEIQE